MISKYLRTLGKLDDFEIKTQSLVFCLMGPSIYLYSVLIVLYNENVIELPYRRELFSLLFLGIGLLPLLNIKKVNAYYGLYVFCAVILFQGHLTYTVWLNGFSIDYLLGTYIVMFGSILLLNNRKLLILFSTTQLLHMSYRVMHSSLDSVTEGAILVSSAVIFFYSFIIINGSIRYRRELIGLNEGLEYKIKERTQDLENRAKELHEKNKDLEEFAYVVSHDLRRPLRNIHTLAEWLLDPADQNDQQLFSDEEHVMKIKEQIQQMELLVNGILNYSLQIKKEKEVVKIKLETLLGAIIDANQSTDVSIEVKKELPNLLFNESQIVQVFQNLIQNAIKHNDKARVEIVIDVEDIGNAFRFAVTDNGPGIAPKYHNKIFQLFQKLEIKPQVDSIGIGLALVKKIIERAGGEIWLESKIDQGTTFFFTVKHA